jgi:CIC family chloride channel protein
VEPLSAPPKHGLASLLRTIRTIGQPVIGGFEGSRYLLKWLVLGTAIGIVAGIGAVLLFRGIELATQFFLGDLVGYLPPRPIGEGKPVREAMARPWLLPVATALGGLISGIIVFTLAPEAEGHGTDAAIDAIQHKAGKLRARVPPIKLVASAITIGSGGSGGREGPTAQISAGFGSLMSQWLGLSVADRRIAVSAGMGAGIGAIFRAPLGGAVMAAEILYIHDLEVEALMPSLIASIVGYSIFGAIEGWEPIFGAQPSLGFQDPLTLVYYAGLGIACGLVGMLYAWTFYNTAGAFNRLRLPQWLKPALGGLLVGLLGLKVEGALHTGYGWVQIGMSDQLMTLPLWLVLVLPFAKILATSLSIGSGGSGGIFGPGMVIGGMLGAAVWRLGEGVLPQMPNSPATFVIIGMMALFGGIAHAPLAVMLMVAEMTGNLSLLAPAMVAVAVSTALVGDHTIYRAQLPDRSHSPAHRVRFGIPLLSTVLVRDAMVREPVAPASSQQVTVSVHDTLDVAMQQLSGHNLTRAVVVEDGEPIGVLTLDGIVAATREAAARRDRRAGPRGTGIQLRLPPAVLHRRRKSGTGDIAVPLSPRPAPEERERGD